MDRAPARAPPAGRKEGRLINEDILQVFSSSTIQPLYPLSIWSSLLPSWPNPVSEISPWQSRNLPTSPRSPMRMSQKLPHLNISASPESNLLIHFYPPPTVTSPLIQLSREKFIVLHLSATITVLSCDESQIMGWLSQTTQISHNLSNSLAWAVNARFFARNLWQVSPNLMFLRTKGGGAEIGLKLAFWVFAHWDRREKGRKIKKIFHPSQIRI